jgi:hypothetical protein
MKLLAAQPSSSLAISTMMAVGCKLRLNHGVWQGKTQVGNCHGADSWHQKASNRWSQNEPDLHQVCLKFR